MELISRSAAKGRVLVRRGAGGIGIGVVEGAESGGAFWAEGVPFWRTCWAFSSQAARAAGSMGHEAGGGSCATFAMSPELAVH